MGYNLFRINHNRVDVGDNVRFGNGLVVSTDSQTGDVVIELSNSGGSGGSAIHAATHYSNGADSINAYSLDYTSGMSISEFPDASPRVIGTIFDKIVPLSARMQKTYSSMEADVPVDPDNVYTQEGNQSQFSITTQNSSRLSGNFKSFSTFGSYPWVPKFGGSRDYLATGLHINTQGNEASSQQAACITASRYSELVSNKPSSLVAIMGQGPGAFVNASTISDFGFYAAVAQTPGHVPVGFVSAVRGANGSAVAPTYIALSTIIGGINYAIYCDYPTNVKIQLPSSSIGLPTGAFYRDGNGFVKSV